MAPLCLINVLTAKWNATKTEAAIIGKGRSGCGKRGVEFKGGSLHDGFGASPEHLALLVVVLQNAEQKATVTVLTVSAVMAVSVMMATPLKLNSVFGDWDRRVKTY